MMLDECQARVGVYRILDDVIASTSVPPGAMGAMYSIIDGLRSSAAPPTDLRRAEQISIALHRLKWALHGDEPRTVASARGTLKELAAEWIQGRISTRQLPG